MVFGMEYKTLELSKISLDLENPRHETLDTEAEAIAHLFEEEKTFPLAKDIAENGLSPFERFAVVKKDDGSFFCAEGNRRICALKLLNNPELAPTKWKNRFEKISKEFDAWKEIKILNVVEFENREEAGLWLERIHAGENNGIGRVKWSPEQQARNNSNHKNKFAVMVLDHAEKFGYISNAKRNRRSSTVTNWLEYSLMCEALGLDANNTDFLTTDLSDADFRIVFGKFMEDVAEKEITTRVKKDEIKDYIKELSKLKGFTNQRVDKRNLASAGSLKIKKSPKPKKPTEPKKPKVVPVNIELEKALEQLDNYKLKNIYYSLCEIELLKHTPLLYVVAWVFIETLTAECGRNNSEDGRGGSAFPNYLNKKMHDLSFGTSSGRKTIGQAVKFISERGNTTKHDKRVAGFNDLELVSNFQIIEPLLLALAKDAKGKTK